jgi:hypothetical protein
MPDGRFTTNSDFMAFDEGQLKYCLEKYSDHENINISPAYFMDTIKSGGIKDDLMEYVDWFCNRGGATICGF